MSKRRTGIHNDKVLLLVLVNVSDTSEEEAGDRVLCRSVSCYSRDFPRAECGIMAARGRQRMSRVRQSDLPRHQ